MAENGKLGYYECDPRAILTFESFHIPRRLLRTWRQRPYEMKIDRAFLDVVSNCRKDRPEWISSELVDIYLSLHECGYAHSVEAWLGDRLVGGLYGMAIGSVFMAESMFHSESNASNCCLIFLMDILERGGFSFCDIQYPNDHTLRFKPESWPQDKFKQHFFAARDRSARFSDA